MTTCVLCHEPLVGSCVVNVIARHGVPQRSVECPSCTLVQADPKPEPHTLRRYYESGQYRAEYPLTPGPLYQATLDPAFIAERARRLVELHGLDRERADHTYHTVYDHGCSDGATMAAVKRMCGDSANVYGWDIDPAMRDAAWSKHGVRTVEDMRSWDLVTAHHVLEHELDPVDAVRRLASRAIKGGRVHVEVPDVEAFTSPSDWQWPHVVNFSARTLRATLEAGGLTDVHTDKLGRFLIGWGRTT